MEALHSFIKEYGSIIIAALSVIVGFVAILVKKHPKTLDDFEACLNEVLANVPALVSIYEHRIGRGHGSEKKAAVLVEANRQMINHLGRNLSKEESDYVLSRISTVAENVLEAPQKKGVE